ncbi:MAG: ankyrin repeat domain-containing protein [Chloroflexi bacterium]|nr:ankyrin repeat domain-containing protein [Chloroflexota bacterium]
MSIDPIFLRAIQAGDIKRVGRLLEADPGLAQESDENGLSPLMVAAYHQQPEIAELIANRSALLSVFEAAAIGRLPHIVRLLARHPELVHACAEDGFQPLGLAAFFGRFEAAEYLVKAGAPVNEASRNPLKVAPLHSAVAGGHTRLAELLLENGADPLLRQSGGFMPLHAAAQNGQEDMIRLLLLNGADLQAQCDDGRTALDMAQEAGHETAVRLLKSMITKRPRRNRT